MTGTDQYDFPNVGLVDKDAKLKQLEKRVRFLEEQLLKLALSVAKIVGVEQ